MRRLLALVAFLFVFIPAMGQERPAPSLTMISPPQVADDTISLSVRVNGADPRRVAALTADNFAVSEPFTDLTVSAEPRLPLTIGVMVNLSVNGELLLIQRTLHAYFDTYYREGDGVEFTLLTGRAPVNVTAASKAEIDAIIDGMTISPIYFSVGDALPDFAEMLAEAQAADRDRVVMGLLVTSFINNASEVRSADAFADAGIPLHIVQAHTFRESFTENLREMAARTGGIFANNQAGALAIGTPPQPVGALKVLFDAIGNSRLVFDVRYRSTATDLTPEPTVTLTLQLSANEIVGLPFSYRRVFQPPVVEFANPNISVVRRTSRLSSGETAFDTARQDIAVYIRYPDAVPRRIRTLQLEIIDVDRGAVTHSQILTDPQVDTDGAYHITWSLDDYASPGTSTGVTIRVSATDEIGLTASVEQKSSVAVAALPPLPTAIPTIAPTATLTPVPPTPTAVLPTAIPTEIPAVATTNARANASTVAQQTTLFGRTLPVSLETLTSALAILVLIAVAVALLLLLRLRRVRRQIRTGTLPLYADSRMDMPTPLPSGDAPPANAVAEADSRVLGRLIVKRGLPPQEIPINSTSFLIGRKAGEGINLVIDAPYISPRHCQITFRSNRFLIRDLGSKNGTFVNGERILPERDTIVPNGSEVEITRQVVFELWDPDTVVHMDYHMDDAHTERLTSRISTATADSVSFPSALGIRAADDDDGEIGEDYSPV